MGWMKRLPKTAEKVLGTVTFKSDYADLHDGTKFLAGQTVNVSKAMYSPGGIAYYKVFGTTVWVTANNVKDINVTVPQRRIYKSVL